MSTDHQQQPSQAQAEAIDLLTPGQASALLKVPVNTLQAWRSRRPAPLPYCRVGRHVRYRREDIAEFLDRNTLGRG